MAKNIRDAERIDRQEKHDYDATKTIIENLYINYNCTFEQMPRFNASDMRYTAEKDDDIIKYNVEIKTRNQDMNRFPQLPLTKKKRDRLINDTKEDERLLYIVLVNNEEYYVFNLDDIKWSEIPLRVWRIKVQEYNKGGSSYEEVPTYFIPLDKIKYHGYL